MIKAKNYIERARSDEGNDLLGEFEDTMSDLKESQKCESILGRNRISPYYNEQVLFDERHNVDYELFRQDLGEFKMLGPALGVSKLYDIIRDDYTVAILLKPLGAHTLESVMKERFPNGCDLAFVKQTFLELC